DIDKINFFYEEVRAEKGVRQTVINGIKYTIKKNARKKENNDFSYDVTQTVVMEFDKSSIVGKEFIRIDGNHRLSAVKEESSYANKRIPYCLLLFRDDIETDKFCRALFYNINAKQIPLKMEHNLKVIIESEQAFNDETLKKSFGFSYYLTRKIIETVNDNKFPFIKMLVTENVYTYFVELFQLLLDKNLIEKIDESVDEIFDVILKVDQGLKKVRLTDMPKCLAVIGAFTYYTIADEVKASKFLKWAQGNSLMDIPELHMGDVIDIYDKIYNNAPKKIFMSMWFDEKTKDTFKEVKDVEKIVKEKYSVELDVNKVDENKDGYSDDIGKKIIEGIDNCDLLIADLSYGNRNVHHEIGYAQGKGKKVLLLYRMRDGVNPSDEIGSNLSMYNQLRFNTYGELRESLLEKIKDCFSLEK
ncbi:MAG: nucleoside 2-deoxyribosyltransferase, partial [Clostridium sp.]|nr:nucleoside 2-deoxyribosyltransferase [Clostridium sp.]